jgi:molybdenum cofactor cytidylyltransferase
MLGSQTVLEHSLAAVRASGLPWHLEQAEHPGMGDSIAAAVRATSGAHGWLILPADLPLIQSSTLQRVAQALQQLAGQSVAVVMPVLQKTGGARAHPVGFAATCRSSLMALSGDQGAARLMKSLGALELVVDDIGSVRDIDTVEDLAWAADWLAQRPNLATSSRSGRSS